MLWEREPQYKSFLSIGDNIYIRVEHYEGGFLSDSGWLFRTVYVGAIRSRVSSFLQHPHSNTYDVADRGNGEFWIIGRFGKDV